MPLVIIKADEVRDGEPRWWCISVESARRDIDSGTKTPTNSTALRGGESG